MKKILKTSLFSFFEKMLSNPDFNDLFNDKIIECQGNVFQELSKFRLSNTTSQNALTFNQDKKVEVKSNTPIFITARYRSGSTYLWNLFRSIPGITSYYEPLNERQWFNPETRHVLKKGTDSSHIGVKNYWDEYQSLENLGQWFDKEWTYKQLYMDGTCYDPNLYNFISTLINSSDWPVLQFNRVDFRLAWLRANFPHAIIIHLYRNPRDQWLSIQRAGKPVPQDDIAIKDINNGLFYTYPWCRNLSKVFPFLNPRYADHPYELHYLLWRLSYLFGQHYANVSISYDKLVKQVDTEMPKLLSYLNINDFDISSLVECTHPGKENRWKAYADSEWYEQKEKKCEQILQAYFFSVTSI